ncbi:MAG: hypothetical protein ACPGPE_00460 [Planctomycetota bacterium]
MARRTEKAPQRPQQGFNPAPIVLLIVGILGAAFAVALASNKNKKDKEERSAPAPAAAPDAAPGSSSSNPFSDIDNSPSGTAGTRRTFSDLAPPDLLDHTTFLAARAIADEGVQLAAEAQKAREAGDEAAFQKKGAVAKAKLDTAFERIADWLLEIQDLYPNDRQVAKVEREVQRWDRARKKVRVVR